MHLVTSAILQQAAYSGSLWIFIDPKWDRLGLIAAVEPDGVGVG
jgi:hypothetical protein